MSDDNTLPVGEETEVQQNNNDGDVNQVLTEEEPDQANDQNIDDGNKGGKDAAETAAAAAAAVAARLMAEHGQSEPASENEGTTNKRAREDDEADDESEHPDKKRPVNGLITDTDTVADMAAGKDPPKDPSGAQLYTEHLDVPAAMVGKLIGRGGETIRNLQQTTDTHIQIDHAGEGATKRITISGYNALNVQNAKESVLKLENTEDDQVIIECPPNLVGRIIGRGGETIRALQSASQAQVVVNQNFPPEQNRQVIIQGMPEAIERAKLMVNELIHGEPGSAQAVIQRVCQAHGIGKSEIMTAPKMIIGKVIGRGGETIKQIQKTSGATVQIDQSGDPCKLMIAGQPSAVEQAKAFLTEIINGGDPFSQHVGYGGGYPGGGMPASAPYGGGYGGAAPYGAPAPYGGAAPYGGYGAYAAHTGGYGMGYDMSGVGAMPQPAVAMPPSPWQEYHDDQGRAYYYNTTTGVTQWEKPSDF